MVSRKKAGIAIALSLLLVLSLGGTYLFLSNYQNPLVQQALNYITVSNIRQIYYPWITPIITSINLPEIPQDWYNDMFDIPEDLPNVTLPNFTGVPPIEMFDYGLIDPNAVMMVVHPNDTSAPTRYWRLEAYDYYNMDWNKTLTASYPYNPSSVPSDADYLYTVYMNFTHSASASTMIPALFPNYTIVDAGQYRIGTVQGDLTSFNITMDEYNSTYLNGYYTGAGLSTLNYTVAGYSINLDVINDTADTPDQTPFYIRDIYTQVPPYLSANSTFIDFVNSIDASGTVYQTALNVMSRLTSGEYTYSASILLIGGGPPEGVDPVIWFLQEKQGICVHFASTFVMTLRELGISARLVVGFLGGEITVDPQLGLVHIIRAINAHAWAEVWVPSTQGEGQWVQFDPTPGPAQNGTNPDPNVQSAYQLILNASPSIVPRNTQITINAILTNATSGDPINGANVSFYIFDPVTLNKTYIGNDTTNANGLAQTTTTLNTSYRVGPIIFLAKAYNQTFPSFPLVSNYTQIFLTGNSTIENMTAKSTPPYQGNDSILIRNEADVLVEGRLIDPDCNNSDIVGIPGMAIEVYHNGSSQPVASGFTDSQGYFTIYCPGSVLELTDYVFSASYSGYYYFGSQIISPTSANASNVIHVYVRPTLSVSVDPYMLKQNDTTTITAHLEYDNDEPISDMNVSIYWDNSSITNGLVKRLPTTENTSASGDVTYNNTVYEKEAVVQVFANFSGSGRILGVNSSKVNVYIYDEGLIIIDDAPDEAAIGDTITVSGWVLDGAGNLRPNTDITVWFYGPAGPFSYPATSDGQGNFSRSILISTDFSPGNYVINATSDEPYFEASSTQKAITIYVEVVFGSSSSGAQGLSLDGVFPKQSIEQRSVMPSESAYITGFLRDALGNSYQYQEITIYYGSTCMNRTLTGPGGAFNITLNSTALSLLPVNELVPLNLSFAGNDTRFLKPYWEIRELHVFDSAQLLLQLPSVGTIGSNYPIQCTSVDPNGNLVMGRAIDIIWNSTHMGSSLTDSEGTILYTYFINPDNNTEGNVTVVVALEDTSFNNSATIYIMQSSVYGGLAAMLLYTLQMGSEAPWLLVVIVLAIVAVICVIYLARRMSSKEEELTVTPLDLKSRIVELKDLVDAGKFNDAVKLLYGMFTDTISQFSGLTRAPNETTREFAIMVIKKEGLNPQLVNGLTQLFERARYSNKLLSKDDYNKAAKYFAELYSLISGGSLKLA
ncbi:MAG: transglutaminase domain-containing protein [Candidatus Freyarchaeota archaeon]